jgi:hypothetical protein
MEGWSMTKTPAGLHERNTFCKVWSVFYLKLRITLLIYANAYFDKRHCEPSSIWRKTKKKPLNMVLLPAQAVFMPSAMLGQATLRLAFGMKPACFRYRQRCPWLLRAYKCWPEVMLCSRMHILKILQSRLAIWLYQATRTHYILDKDSKGHCRCHADCRDYLS